MLLPTRSLVLFAGVPLLVSLGTLVERSWLGPTLVLDALVALVALADALLSRRGAVAVERRAPTVFSVGRPNPVTLELRSTLPRRVTVELVDELFDDAEADGLPVRVELAPRGRAQARYHVTPTVRGAFALGAHHLRFPSRLGLWTRQLRVDARHELRVYPDVEAVRAYELLAKTDRLAGVRSSRKRGGETEFERLREYRQGDEYRSIDWSASARTRKLVAREYQLESNQSVVFALDAGRMMTAELGGLSSFDHALNATLMLSHVASRAGDHIGLVAFSDELLGFVPPGGGPRAARKIVQASYALLPSLVESDFDELGRTIGVRLRKRSLVVLFTSVVDEVAAGSLLRLVKGLSTRHLPLVVMMRDVALETLALGGPASSAAAHGLYERAAAAELLVERDRLLRELRQRGALVLDVAPGELSPQLVRRYLDIKARHLL
jgi:uncharacterized protein (DUF58 family)